MMIFSLALVCAGAAIAGAKRQAAGSQEPSPQHAPVVGDWVNLTTLHVSVYDHDGKLVDGLPQEVFHVYEDNAEQKIAELGQKDEPARIGLLVDSSGSMFHAIQPETDAIRRFVRASNTQDKFFAVAFADSVRPAPNV